MASIFKRKRTVDGKSVEARKYTVQYADASGQTQRVAGFTDKARSWELAKKLESGEAESNHVKHRKTPLTTHLGDFKKSLLASGSSAKHVNKTYARVKRVIEGCGFHRIANLDAAKVETWLEEQRNRKKKPIGISTSNHYLVSIKHFAGWLVENHRAPSSSLTHLSRQNAETDVRRQRRTLTDKEFAKFIQATRGSAAYRGISGPDRAMLYLIAANTGLRASELASLTSESFHLEGELTVMVEAAYSKHKRRDVLPLRADVAKAVGGWTQGRSGLLWPGTWVDRAAEMIRADLEAAGIEYKVKGAVFDFHALRHQFISSLAKAGVHPKVAQQLARHSTITLTMDRYSHLDTPQLVDGLDRLPASPFTEDLTQNLTQGDDFGRPETAQDGTTATGDRKVDDDSQPFELQGVGVPILDLSQDDTSRPGRTRTYDQGIMSPLL